MDLVTSSHKLLLKVSFLRDWEFIEKKSSSSSGRAQTPVERQMYAYQQSCENYKVLSKAQKAQRTRKANSRGIREAFLEIRPEISLENGLIWTMELDILGT